MSSRISRGGGGGGACEALAWIAPILFINFYMIVKSTEYYREVELSKISVLAIYTLFARSIECTKRSLFPFCWHYEKYELMPPKFWTLFILIIIIMLAFSLCIPSLP